MSNTHRPATIALAALAVLLCALLVPASQAHALEVRKLKALFGEEQFGERVYLPNAVAIDQTTGNVYVTTFRKPNEAVDVFGAEGGAPAGGVPAQLTAEETPGGEFGEEMESIAVDNGCYFQGLSGAGCRAFDPSSGDIYVGSGGGGGEGSSPQVFDKFAVNGSNRYEYLCQVTGATPCLPRAPASASKRGGIAVGVDGDVYLGVNRPGGGIVEYNPAGEPIANTSDNLVGVESLALDAKGDIYFYGYWIENGGEVVGVAEIKRSPSGGFLPVEKIYEAVGTENDVRGIAFDVATGHLLVGFTHPGGGGRVEELNENHEVVGTFTLPAQYEVAGLAVNDETNEVYVALPSTDSGTSSAVAMFGAPVTLADVSTGGVARVHRTSATIEGSVSPHAIATTYYFEYGESAGYGSSTAPHGTAIQTGTSATLEGLEPGREYHYRLVAENANGPSYGADRTFTTPLAVEGIVSGAASVIGTTGAKLSGSLEPDGEDAQAWFEYGPANGSSGVYGGATPKVDRGSASEEVPAEAALSGLQPNATYHYRLAAEDALGVSYGSDRTFTTLAAAPAFDLAPSASQETRAGALVTGAVNPQNSATTVHVVYVDEAQYAPGSSEPYAAGGATQEVEVGSGFGDAPVVAPVGGLTPATTYHYALVARDQAGTSVSADGTFTTAAGTPPVLSTGGVSAVGANTATLSGMVATEGLPTSYGFQVAASAAAFGPPSGLGSVGAGAGEEAVSFTLVGLLPGTTYRYRIVASNVDGTSYGAESSFATPAPVGALGVPPALSLIAAPQLAFPSGSEVNTATPVKHRAKTKHKARRRNPRSRGKGKRGAGGGKGSRGRRKG